jgi:hypothetical protein
MMIAFLEPQKKTHIKKMTSEAQQQTKVIKVCSHYCRVIFYTVTS